MKNLFVFIRSLIYVPLFILAFGWIAQQVRVLDIRFGISLPEWMNSAGILSMVIGGIIVLLCVWVFITRGKGTPAVFDPPREFVATGPYAYVRNPMYIGGFILLVGFGLYHKSFSILVLAIILAGLFHLFVVFYEEHNLEKLFGKSYLDYKKRINRWIPSVKGK